MVSLNIDVLIGNSEMYFQMWVDKQMLMFIRLTFPTRYLQRNHWILIPRIALSVLKLSNCKEVLCTVLKTTFTGELWVVHASWQRLRYQIITAITKICGMHFLLEASSIRLNVFSYYNFIKIMSPCCQFGNCDTKSLNKIWSINIYNDQMMWQIKIIKCREKFRKSSR